jgi:hypothetical protein
MAGRLAVNHRCRSWTRTRRHPRRTGGAPPAVAGRAGAPPQPWLGSAPKPAIANAKPVRSCESLATVALPNTTIESAALDPVNPAICRVTAVTTHPPAGDKVRIWIGILTANWNGRFLGVGGGGFVGGSPASVDQPRPSAMLPGRLIPGMRAAAAAAALPWMPPGD